MPTEQLNSAVRLSPKSRNRQVRSPQNGGMSPLDIGSGQNDIPHEDLPHLSPVYEAGSPSPTNNRKFEPVMDRKANGVTVNTNEDKQEPSKAELKLALANGTQNRLSAANSKPNGHTRASKSEGSGPGNWQKIPTNKKKGGLTELKSAANGQPHSEKVPRNESERKGG
jgi:hypothetical protein